MNRIESDSKVVRGLYRICVRAAVGGLIEVVSLVSFMCIGWKKRGEDWQDEGRVPDEVKREAEQFFVATYGGVP